MFSPKLSRSEQFACIEVGTVGSLMLGWSMSVDSLNRLVLGVFLVLALLD